MSLNSDLDLLSKNPADKRTEAVRLLCKIADNILKCPDNLKIRTLQKGNETIRNKIMQVPGAKECLKQMGFVERDQTYTLDMNMPLDTVRDVRNAIVSYIDNLEQNNAVKAEEKQESQVVQSVSEVAGNVEEHEWVRRIVLPPIVHMFTNPFLRRMEVYSHHTLQYEDKALQARAKNKIPLMDLEYKAERKFRDYQEMIKKKKIEINNVSVKDMLLLELMNWFKTEFFSWVDSPDCEKCGGASQLHGMARPGEYKVYTDRVEVHKCKSCSHLTSFPRYNDLHILLETRRGRCGEWANTFTLLCRALGYDARFVVEESDHVWTEVYSITQERWLHLDPCENVCDTPLMYETGWNKKISYVMAYSSEEIQDVTWRYSSDHKAVMRRRNLCTEKDLLDALFKIREKRTETLSDARKMYLTKRLAYELVHLMVERKPGDDEHKGRSSGSEGWRLARGEIRDTPEASFIWQIDTDVLEAKSASVKYYCALDKYEYVTGDKKLREVKTWHTGAYKCDEVFRKEEKDWQKVYLATNEAAKEGSVTWKFTWSGTSCDLDSVSIHIEHETFEEGVIRIEVFSGDKHMVLPKGSQMDTFNNLGDTKELTVTATMIGGKSWQHAQLFRQDADSESCSCNFKFTFK